jgi:hypothetical protein
MSMALKEILELVKTQEVKLKRPVCRFFYSIL